MRGEDLDLLAEDQKLRRVWLVSPAAATILFFALQLVLSLASEPGRPGVEGAGAQAPSAAIRTRVVAQIKSVSELAEPGVPVPRSEAALLELFERQETVVFSGEEVDTLGTQEARFLAEEVGIITSDNKLRRAKAAPSLRR